MAESTTATSSSEIMDEVRRVLQRAAKGKGRRPNYLTAYQVLNRLQPQLRSQLISERGRGGRHQGHHFAAPSLVERALRRLVEDGEVEVAFLDTGGLQLLIDGQQIEAGNRVCALYRWSQT